jgi:hypothetical protein
LCIAQSVAVYRCAAVEGAEQIVTADKEKIRYYTTGILTCVVRTGAGENKTTQAGMPVLPKHANGRVDRVRGRIEALRTIGAACAGVRTTFAAGTQFRKQTKEEVLTHEMAA